MTDQETLAALAVWHPGVIRTLRVLEGELRDSADLPPEVLHGVGVLVRRIGEAVIDHATTTVDASVEEVPG